MTHVYLLTLDAFRYGLLSTQATPFLSEFRSESMEFTNAIATGSGTSSSFTGILSGVLPLEHGYTHVRPEHTTIAEHLPESVVTAGVSSSAPTSHIYDMHRGFEYFSDGELSGRLGRLKTKVSSMDLVQDNELLFNTGKKVLNVLQSSEGNGDKRSVPYTDASVVSEKILTASERFADEDLFVWGHFMETHTPYHPPTEFTAEVECEFSKDEVNDFIDEYNRGRGTVDDPEEGDELNGEQVAAAKQYYEAEAANLDNHLKQLITRIKSTQADAMFIVCADHGEEFWEHGSHGHGPTLYNELVHVPLMIHGNGIDTTKERTSPVSLAQIPATVADLFDTAPPDKWESPSLLQPQNRNHVLSEISHIKGLGGDVRPDMAVIAATDGDEKYILNQRNNSREAYDLRDDPR